MKWWQIALIVLGAAVAVLIAFGMWKESGTRQKNMQDQLTRNGWTRAEGDPSLLTRWPGEPFDQGRDHQATNVITGQYRGHAIIAFDLSFVARAGNQSNATYEYSVYVISTGRTGSPRAAQGKQLAALTSDSDLGKRLTAFGNKNRTFRLVDGDLLTWDLTTLEAFAGEPGHMEAKFDLLVDVAERIPTDAWETSQ